MAISEKRKKYLCGWRNKNRERINKRQREWAREWRKKNPERAKERDRSVIDKYREQRKTYNSWYYKNRIKNDYRFKLRHIFSSAISARLRKRLSGKNCKSTFDYLDYTIDDLVKHLESKFRKGMSWKNYGKWHIDHIIPDISFKYISPKDKEFKNCWALNNLQPLWAKENIKKGQAIADFQCKTFGRKEISLGRIEKIIEKHKAYSILPPSHEKYVRKLAQAITDFQKEE